MSGMIQTYIEGFDYELGGGIPEGHTILLSGTPGTMKSSLALNILYNNMKNADKKCLYISLEESKKSLTKMMKNLGMDEFDEEQLFIVDLGKLRLDYKEADEELDWFNILYGYLKRRVEEEGVSIVAIDSITALYSLVNLKNPRQELFHFFGFLKSLEITTILITEMPYGSVDMVYPYREDFLTDGNLLLKLHDVGETDVQLRIRCVKMRHTNHQRGYFALMHRGNRFMVTSVISD